MSSVTVAWYIFHTWRVATNIFNSYGLQTKGGSTAWELGNKLRTSHHTKPACCEMLTGL